MAPLLVCGCVCVCVCVCVLNGPRWIGTPAAGDIEAIQSGVLRKILGDWTAANPLPGKGLASKYSSATPDAIQLLESMLQFNPAGRCVLNVLQHPNSS